MAALALLLASLPLQRVESQLPSAAPDADADAKCVLTFDRLGAILERDAANLDVEGRGRRDYARAALAYFIGRLADRHPGPSLEAAITATNASFPTDQYANEGQRCASEFDGSMRRIGGELRESSAASPQPGAPADNDLICLAVFTDTGERIRRMPGTPATAITAYLESLRVGTPFYAARVVPRYEPGRLGPALQAAIRDFPRDRLETLLRGCFDEMTRVTQRVSRAAEDIVGPTQPAH